MDFGLLGLNPDNKRKDFGSGSGEDDWRKVSKMVKSDEFLAPKTMALSHGSNLVRSNSLASVEGGQQEQMLSFSSLKSDAPFHHFQHSSVASSRNAGYGSMSMNGKMHGSFGGVRGPFTPSQWIELEHQALIYKYITANVPVPSNLLIPLKRSINLYGLSGFSAGSYRPTSLRWGSYHLGYSGNTDPEPGRCRRTDGKKWRCSRDAVADQKYCERHINRGRHRSRKPVEGQTGHASSGTTSSMSMSVISSGGASNNIVIPQHQFKTKQQTGVSDPSAGALVNRIRDAQTRNIMSSTIDLKSKESPISIPKQSIPFGGSSHSDFGLVSSDSLLNPSQNDSYISTKNYGSILDFNDQETQDQHPLRHFIDDWPKDQSNRAVITWPEELKSDWPQLSISIPMASSGFSSSSSSPTQEKLALSPLRLSCDFDPIQKQTNWIPISWETSMGGPLGEVLTRSAGTEGWDTNLHFGSSPTGVLQKLTFGSMSNSSSGSSPRTDNNNHDRVSYCDDMLGSALL